MTHKTVATHVLGCKVNQYELEGIKELFVKQGYEIVHFSEKADVYLIHTCTVTSLSDKKSRQYIRRANKANPHGIIVVSGCYAQVSPDEVRQIEGVDIIIGTKDRSKIVDMVNRFDKGRAMAYIDSQSNNTIFEELPTFRPSRARAFLKIQEGCDRYCTYCIVPYARGPVKSRTLDRTVREVKKIVEQGYREIVLTGVHLGLYGKDFPGQTRLDTVIEELVKIEGLNKIRISSLDPDDINDNLLRIITEHQKVCAHYHIPLQSGDDRVLKAMGRRYTTSEYCQIVEKIRKKRPDAAITTDIIVGFPGEDEDSFQRSYSFVEAIGFTDMHIFKFSPRKGTPAATYDKQVAEEIKNRRSQKLHLLSEKMWVSFAQQYLMRKMPVLVESQQGKYWEGHTDNYLKVRFLPCEEGILPGDMELIYLESLLEGKVVFGEINC